MAGIGFELKKLFKGKGYLENFKAYFVATLVTIGPMILCIIMLTVLQQILIAHGVGFSQRELFQSVIMYAFIFSLIASSGMILLVSRFISDKIYQKRFDLIMPSLYGVLAIGVFFGGIAGAVFYWYSPLGIYLKAAAYIFYMELLIIWIQSIYVSLFRDYFKILNGFIYGAVTAIILSYICLSYTTIDPVLGLLTSLDIGFLVIIISHMNYFMKYLSFENTNVFSFLAYFDRYPALVFIGFFYYFGMYVHNFIFWSSGYSAKIANTFWFSPIYDIPMFYAYFTISPTLVMFVVSVETSFFNKYKGYYKNILQGGNYEEISAARKEMSSVLAQEISYIMEIQLVFSILFLILGRKFLPMIGLSSLAIDIFSILVPGCFVFIMMYVIVMIMLYFDDRKGALAVMLFFVPLNIIFTLRTLDLGENFFGTGFFAAGLLALLLAIARLVWYVKNIDYYTFCSQPLLYKEKSGFFTRLAAALEKKNIDE